DGYVVRSRADADTKQARDNDTSTRDAALASGAQWVSTDYPVPGLAVGFTSPYFAEIPGGTVARCNPVNAPPSCVSSELDKIFTPVPPPADPFATTTTTPPAATTTPTSIPSTTVGVDGGVDPAGAAQPVGAQPAFTG
ncbi:MAG: Ca2+-dependent phosphoinositide-specific phospholipase C, partial [Acidimicrobiales bacterium]